MLCCLAPLTRGEPAQRLNVVSPGFIGDHASHRQTDRQTDNHHKCAECPIQSIDSVEAAEVPHRAVHIQAGHHDYDRRHSQADARIAKVRWQPAALTDERHAEARIPARNAPMKVAISGATLKSCNSKRNVSVIAPISAAVRHIRCGELNSTEKPTRRRTPPRTAANR